MVQRRPQDKIVCSENVFLKAREKNKKLHFLQTPCTYAQLSVELEITLICILTDFIFHAACNTVRLGNNEIQVSDQLGIVLKKWQLHCVFHHSYSNPEQCVCCEIVCDSRNKWASLQNVTKYITYIKWIINPMSYSDLPQIQDGTTQKHYND